MSSRQRQPSASVSARDRPMHGMRPRDGRRIRDRSGIGTVGTAARAAARARRTVVAPLAEKARYGAFTTWIRPAPSVQLAAEDLRQFLATAPGASRGPGGPGVYRPAGSAA